MVKIYGFANYKIIKVKMPSMTDMYGSILVVGNSSILSVVSVRKSTVTTDNFGNGKITATIDTVNSTVEIDMQIGYGHSFIIVGGSLSNGIVSKSN